LNVKAANAKQKDEISNKRETTTKVKERREKETMR
jgi:hypothetical protein